MARKRLYGETQKRRNKKQTQELKRQNSVTRVKSTHQPAPFQRNGEVSSQDVTFLEAMRDMEVEHYPRAGEAPVRQEKFETVHFAATQEDENSFLGTMENLGVRPMSDKTKGRPSRPGGIPARGQADGRADLPPGTEPGPQGVAGGDAYSGEGASADTARPVKPEPLAGEARDRAEWPLAEEARDRAERPAQPAKPQRKHAATTFQLDEDDAEMMAGALLDEEFDPKAKFEGAPPSQPKRPDTGKGAAQRAASPQGEDGEREPDAELDLHGKTQEESIRMVQNFLLTSYHRNLRHVLIITGKGHNSGAVGPVLREAVYHWLERNGERFAKSFAWAPARHGGEGAIWVVLR